MDGAHDGTGAQFAWQHDAQLHADGTLTLFDNQAAPPVGERSRGLRLALDTEAMTATVVQEWLPTDPTLLAGSQGNLQVLPGGNVVVCGLGPPALATAGTGDVLTGILAAFLAKGLDPQTAAVAAAVAHARAAELVPHRAGLVAGDLLGTLPAALER